MNGSERTFTTEQIRLERRLPSYWRVTFDIPPLNIFGPKEIPQLNEIISAIETDPNVKVVVFDSAVDGFFLTHYDFVAPLEDSTRIPPDGLVSRRCRTCWRVSAGLLSSPSLQSGAERQESEVSSRSPATCNSQVARRRSFRNGRSARALCRVAARWRDCHA